MRAFLAIVLGVAAAMAVIFAVEWLGHMIFPPPSGLDLQDPAALRQAVAAMPPGALVFVLAAYALGGVAGGFAARMTAQTKRITPALMVGTVLLVLGIVNLLQLPHPLWFGVVSSLLYIPAVLLGHRLAKKWSR